MNSPSPVRNSRDFLSRKFSKEKSCEIRHEWTFSGLAGAFLDLTLAFFLLCGAASGFLVTKFLNLFGQRLPCPCQGIFGQPNGICYSPKRISGLRRDLRRRFPYDSVWIAEEGECYHSNLWTNPGETSRRGSVSSWNRNFCYSPSWSGMDEIRRRRRDSASEMSKSPSSFPSSRQNLNFSPGILDVRSMKNFTEFDESESSAIRILEKALEEEQATSSSLYLELEKERNAAATAADEAMGMILRLQKEKASIEMEARHFERVVEERAAYDEEEMNILKEIILRRERENHVLEREIEFYRQMVISGNGQNSELSTENKIQDGENLVIAEFNKRWDEQDECHDDISHDGSEFSLSRTEKNVSDENHTTHDMIFESYEHRKFDLKRRHSGSTCLESERTFHKRRPLMQVNMSCDGFSLSKLRRNSMSEVDRERSKLEAEVESLRDRLKLIQNGREKLGFSENKDKENCHLSLLEEIVSQLRAISMGKIVNQDDWKRRQSPSISSGGLK